MYLFIYLFMLTYANFKKLININNTENQTKS